ncbi:Transcriptional regulatory protein DesR [Acidipropionibacterium virtanenii]|uniref:Transcriptional regulatory protein DesR n=2 Tax=Acidipropionibacterium virtanenii TaxID=2057246 RepID=A0A344UWF3_9ACTN|nr:Transcriptional regulatory protein DesR [Acidipropionibacterium virtanenii]
MTIRLAIADDQALVRGALRALLSAEPDLDVVAECGRGDEVVGMVVGSRPDVCLLDIEMPGLDGITVAEQLAESCPECRVLVVTTFGRPGYLRRAMDAGVAGFIVKDTPASELAQAVRTVHGGGRVIDPELAAESLVEGHNPLTEREQEILRLAEDGSSITVIADRLSLSTGTVRNHVSSAIGKTHSANRAEAARNARELGWL